jgi:hypothetical protein
MDLSFCTAEVCTTPPAHLAATERSMSFTLELGIDPPIWESDNAVLPGRGAPHSR